MNKLILALSFCFLSFSLFAKDVVVDVSLTPAGSFQIKSKKVKGKLKRSGDKIVADGVKVSVKSLKSGIEMRDKHMFDRLEYKKHSKIEIVKAIGQSGKGKGIIKVRGVEKPFAFTYKEMGKEIEAKFKLNLKDFQIKDLRYMSVGVEDIVTITAKLPVK